MPMDTLKKTVLTLDSLKVLTGKSKVLRVFPKVLTENSKVRTVFSKVRTVHDACGVLKMVDRLNTTAAPPNPCTKGHCYSRCNNNRAEGTQDLGADALKYALP